jgi:hypothetical protein
MTGTHMASGTQNIATGAGNAELLDVPGDVTGDRYILIKNLEAEGGNYIEIGSAAAGSFPASVSQKVKGGATVLLCVPSAVAVYALANTATVNIEWKACQV